MKRFNSSKWITENKHGKNLTEGMSPEEWDGAKEKERLNQHPEKDTINKIKKMMDKEKPLKEEGPSNNPYFNALVIKAKEMGIHVNDLMKSLLKDKSEMEIVKMGYQDLAALAGVEDLAETRPDWTPPPMGMGGEDEEQDEYDKGWYGESSDYADRLANSGTDSDGRNTWGDKTGYSDEEMRQGKGKLKKYPDKDGRNVWGDKVDYSDEEKAKSLKEIASELGYIAEESNQYQKASFVYTEQGGHFYSLTLYSSDGQKQKMRYDEANEWLKGVLEYIHEGDLIPRRYNSGLEDLDLIVARLEELGIEASHGDYMDVS